MNQQEIEAFWAGYYYEDEIKKTPAFLHDDKGFWEIINIGFDLLKRENLKCLEL